MSALTVCVYAIAKNEARFVDRWMDSMGEADLVVVTDTGSQDDTVLRLRGRGAVVYQEKVEPWRFDAARNISLGHVPEDVDICVCTDLDEYFAPGWRKYLEDAWQMSTSRTGADNARMGRYLYNWSLKEDGTPDVQFYYTKAHGRNGFRWKWPVHEYVEYVGAQPVEIIMVEGMVLNHAPDPGKSRGSYLPLLEMAVAEEPSDVRMRYYLGREYLYRGEWQKCVDTLTAYLSMPRATWREERCAAMRLIAEAHRSLGRTEDAYAWFFRAVAEAPHMRDPYVEFALFCLDARDWPMASFLAEEALRIHERSSTYVNMGYAWDATPEDVAAIASWHLGRYGAAIRHAENALRLVPGDKRIEDNLRFIRQTAALGDG